MKSLNLIQLLALCFTFFEVLLISEQAHSQNLDLFAMRDKAICGGVTKVFKNFKNPKLGFEDPKNECPASTLTRDLDQLMNAWKSKPSRVLSEELSVDEQSLYELNLEAARIWNEHLACPKLKVGPGKDAAEVARREYYDDSFVCGELKKRYRVYRGQIAAFLESSEIESRARANLYDRLGSLPSVHPLFSQMLVEHLATIKAYYYIDHHYLRSDLGSILTGRSGVQKPDLNKFSQKSVMNALLILGLVPTQDCSNWGLWPRASRTLPNGLEITATYLHVGFNYRPDNQWDVVASNVRRKMQVSCGTWNEFGNGKDPYFQNAAGFIRIFRQLGERK